MTVCFQSNTHNFLVKVKNKNFLPEGDMLVHSGDFTNEGTVEEFRQFDNFLQSVSSYYPYRVVVFGQSDTKLFKKDW